MIIPNDPSDRLQSAILQFRRVGSKSWSEGRYLPPATTTSEIINFANITEDVFGYINVEWDVSNLADGEYELEARTIDVLPALVMFRIFMTIITRNT